MNFRELALPVGRERVVLTTHFTLKRERGRERERERERGLMLPNGCRWGGHHCRAFECSLYKCVFSSKFSRRKARKLWKVDIGPPGKGNSTSYVARPVHQIISMTKWIRTSRLSIKNSLSLREIAPPRGGPRARGLRGGRLQGYLARQKPHPSRTLP